MKKYILQIMMVLSGICNSQLLYDHGFGEGTLVRMAPDCWQHITTVANDSFNESVEVTSYKQCTGQSVRQRVKRGGESDTNCYFTLGFDDYQPDIICTPTQEFYVPHTKQWVAACDLKIGDVLLGACTDHHMHDQHKVLKHIVFVKKPLHVYSIELEHVHTFRVGRHCIVTHNMALPAITVTVTGTFEWLGLTTLGGCFGPVTAGIAIGGVLCCAVRAYRAWNSPTYYELTFDVNHIENRYRTNQENISYKPKGGYRDVQIPSEVNDHNHAVVATYFESQYGTYYNAAENKNKDNEKLSSQEERLQGAGAPGIPTNAEGYTSPKNWDGKKRKHPDTGQVGWPDDRGSIWVPTGPAGSPLAHGGPHWDVIDKHGNHRNVRPGQKITYS